MEEISAGRRDEGERHTTIGRQAQRTGSDLINRPAGGQNAQGLMSEQWSFELMNLAPFIDDRQLDGLAAAQPNLVWREAKILGRHLHGLALPVARAGQDTESECQADPESSMTRHANLCSVSDESLVHNVPLNGNGIGSRAISLFLAALLTFSCSGCIAVAVGAAGGAAGATYVMGKVTENLNAPVAKVYEASVAACRDLDMAIIERASEGRAARVEAEFTDGTRATVAIEAVDDDHSLLTIHAGVIGQEQRARELWEATRRRLPRSAWSTQKPKEPPSADQSDGK